MKYLLPLILVFLGKTAVSIIAGDESGVHALPSIVRINILQARSNSMEYCGMCGGTIINEQWILTNVDCCVTIISERGFRPRVVEKRVEKRDAEEIKITIGAHYDRTCDWSTLCGPYQGVNGDEDGEVKQVEEVVLHPKYQPENTNRYASAKLRTWDACLLRVESIDSFNIEEHYAEQTKLPGIDYFFSL